MVMPKTVDAFIAELIQEYQQITKKTCTEIALDFDITLSNLYRYRMGNGNPRAKTIDKVLSAVEENCPGLLERKRNES